MCMYMDGRRIMAKEITLLFFLAHFLALNCQEEEGSLDVNQSNENGKPSYSFSYGVSDVSTGDIKTVWETKEGDTVKGHYSVLGPDGTLRSVEYSAGPKTGFTAVVNNEENPPTPQPKVSGRTVMEDKAMRDYAKYYDFPDEMEEEFYERKKNKRPYESYREPPSRKRPSYAFDQEPSEYTHSITIKHPRDEASQDAEAHSHVGYSFDPNCKTKTKKESNDDRDPYANILDFDITKKYPSYPSDNYRDPYDKFSEPSNYAYEKVKPYESYKLPKYEDPRTDSSLKYSYPSIPDIPRPEKYYPDDLPPRPKKKRRPQTVSEYVGDDLDDYILVPKKKYKPGRNPEPVDYRPELEDEYDRPYFDDLEERYHPNRENPGKEVVRKVVKKKKKPVVNLLDIFDI